MKNKFKNKYVFILSNNFNYINLSISSNNNLQNSKKQRRQKLNAKWAREGRTANQHKKWKAKQPQGQVGFNR